MNDNIRSITEKLAIYNQLGWFSRWKFRRLLGYICKDDESLALLLGFESELIDESQSSQNIYEKLRTTLNWYNSEYLTDHQDNLIELFSLPDFLQIVFIFLNNTKNNKLNNEYRKLFQEISFSCKTLRLHNTDGIGMPVEHYRSEVSERISRLHKQYNHWDQWHEGMNTRAEFMLRCFLNVAIKVSDKYSFNLVCQQMIPVLGYSTTSSLMALSNDFIEFERYFSRLNAQIAFWGPQFANLIYNQQDRSELNQLLMFLETLMEEPRMQRCIQYHESKNTNHHIFVLKPSDEVMDACIKKPWSSESSYEQVIKNLIGLYVQNIVDMNLRKVWSSVCSRKLKWEYDKFTEYVPYAMRTLNWKEDNEKTRRYWNWQDAERAENVRFELILTPRLCSRFNDLEFSDFDLLFSILPNYIGVQRFAKVLDIPIRWEKGTELQEGYRKWIGFYEEEYDVARPTSYNKYKFEFERPSLQNAINLLDNADKVHEVIQAYKESSH